MKNQNLTKTITALLITFMFGANVLRSQVGSCPNGLIYLHTSPIQAYNPTLPLSATNPSNTGIPGGGGGLAFGPNLNAPAPSPTFYTQIGGFVNWWNGTVWVNTGHTLPTVNHGLGGGFLFSLNGGTGQVYRYNGTGNAVLITTVASFAGGGPYDLAVDCNGNWSIIRCQLPNQYMNTYDPNGNLLCQYSMTGMPSTSAGGGYAIVNGVVYVRNTSGFFAGPITGTVINFSAGPNITHPGDFASCPDCPTLPAIASNNGTLSCGVTSVNVIATTTVAPVTYSWSGPAIQGPANSSVAAVTAPGVYTCTIVSAGCPPISTVITTTVAGSGNIINPTFTVSNILTCANPVAQVTANPGPAGYTYTWTGPGIVNSNNNIANINQPGTYTLSIAEATSTCNGTQTFAVLANTVHPVLSITQSSTAVCSGATVSLTISGATSYTWSTAQTSTLITVTPTATSQYSVVGSFTNGCTSTVVTNVIVISPSLNVTPFYTVCQNTNLLFGATAAPGAFVTWSGPNNFTSSLLNPNINNINPSFNGDYTITTTFSNPNTTLVCTASAVANVSVVPRNAVIAFGTANVCQFATATFSANAPSAAGYEWFGPNGFTSTNQANTITNIQPVSAGNYSVNAIFTIGTVSCTTSSFYPINVIQVPNITVIPTVAVCEHENATFSASAPNALTYLWNGPNTFTMNSPTIMFANLTPSMSGIYTVTASFSNGNLTCYNSNQTHLIVKPILPFNLGPDRLACSNEDLFLNGPAGGTTYNWWGSTSYTSNTQSLFVPSMNPSNTGVYVLEVDLNGCKTYDSINVRVLSPIVFTLTPSNRTVCRGDKVEFVVGAAQGSENYAYTWNPAIYVTNPTGSVQAGEILGTTIYNISAYDIACPNYVIQTGFTVTVNQPPVPNISLPKNNVCEPLCMLFNTGTQNQSEQVTYDFGNGQVVQGDSIIICLPAGEHHMKVLTVGKNGCKGIIDYKVPIVVYHKPGADFTWDPSSPNTSNNQVTFIPSVKHGNTFTYNWQFTNSTNIGGVDTSTAKNPTKIYDNNGKFPVMLEVTNEHGCIDTVFKIVIVDEDFTVYIPNTFTPNDDNINDVFNVKGLGLKTEGYVMDIFDRWGTLIYTTKDINKGWDGTVKGVKAADGVYIYSVKVIGGNGVGKKEFKGHVSLLK